jgi:hypothetical protein
MLHCFYWTSISNVRKYIKIGQFICFGQIGNDPGKEVKDE